MKVVFVCIPMRGHVTPMKTLALGLKQRGHQVRFVIHKECFSWLLDPPKKEKIKKKAGETEKKPTQTASPKSKDGRTKKDDTKSNNEKKKKKIFENSPFSIHESELIALNPECRLQTLKKETMKQICHCPTSALGSSILMLEFVLPNILAPYFSKRPAHPHYKFSHFLGDGPKKVTGLDAVMIELEEFKPDMAIVDSVCLPGFDMAYSMGIPIITFNSLPLNTVVSKHEEAMRVLPRPNLSFSVGCVRRLIGISEEEIKLQKERDARLPFGEYFQTKDLGIKRPMYNPPSYEPPSYFDQLLQKYAWFYNLFIAFQCFRAILFYIPLVTTVRLLYYILGLKTRRTSVYQFKRVMRTFRRIERRRIVGEAMKLAKRYCETDQIFAKYYNPQLLFTDIDSIDRHVCLKDLLDPVEIEQAELVPHPDYSREKERIIIGNTIERPMKEGEDPEKRKHEKEVSLAVNSHLGGGEMIEIILEQVHPPKFGNIPQLDGPGMYDRSVKVLCSTAFGFENVFWKGRDQLPLDWAFKNPYYPYAWHPNPRYGADIENDVGSEPMIKGEDGKQIPYKRFDLSSLSKEELRRHLKEIFPPPPLGFPKSGLATVYGDKKKEEKSTQKTGDEISENKQKSKDSKEKAENKDGEANTESKDNGHKTANSALEKAESKDNGHETANSALEKAESKDNGDKTANSALEKAESKDNVDKTANSAPEKAESKENGNNTANSAPSDEAKKNTNKSKKGTATRKLDAATRMKQSAKAIADAAADINAVFPDDVDGDDYVDHNGKKIISDPNLASRHLHESNRDYWVPWELPPNVIAVGPILDIDLWRSPVHVAADRVIKKFKAELKGKLLRDENDGTNKEVKKDNENDGANKEVKKDIENDDTNKEVKKNTEDDTNKEVKENTEDDTNKEVKENTEDDTNKEVKENTEDDTNKEVKENTEDDTNKEVKENTEDDTNKEVKENTEDDTNKEKKGIDDGEKEMEEIRDTEKKIDETKGTKDNKEELTKEPSEEEDSEDPDHEYIMKIASRVTNNVGKYYGSESSVVRKAIAMCDIEIFNPRLKWQKENPDKVKSPATPKPISYPIIQPSLTREVYDKEKLPGMLDFDDPIFCWLRQRHPEPELMVPGEPLPLLYISFGSWVHLPERVLNVLAYTVFQISCVKKKARVLWATGKGNGGIEKKEEPEETKEKKQSQIKTNKKKVNKHLQKKKSKKRGGRGKNRSRSGSQGASRGSSSRNGKRRDEDDDDSSALRWRGGPRVQNSEHEETKGASSSGGLYDMNSSANANDTHDGAKGDQKKRNTKKKEQSNYDRIFRALLRNSGVSMSQAYTKLLSSSYYLCVTEWAPQRELFATYRRALQICSYKVSDEDIQYVRELDEKLNTFFKLSPEEQEKYATENVDDLDPDPVLEKWNLDRNEEWPHKIRDIVRASFFDMPSQLVFFTHCGMNSVMESLSSYIPMIGVPICLDQCDVATRIALDAGAGLFVNKINIDNDTLLHTLETRLLNWNQFYSYQKECVHFARIFRLAGGLPRAVTAVERAYSREQIRGDLPFRWAVGDAWWEQVSDLAKEKQAREKRYEEARDGKTLIGRIKRYFGYF
eukprot:g91.t1